MPDTVPRESNAQSVIPIARDAELLAQIPALIGGPVRNCLVLVFFRGTRSVATARLDLPHGSCEHAALVEECAGLCAVVGNLDGVAVAVFTEHRLAGRPLPFRKLVRTVAEAVARQHLHIVALLCRGRDDWARYRVP